MKRGLIITGCLLLVFGGLLFFYNGHTQNISTPKDSPTIETPIVEGLATEPTSTPETLINLDPDGDGLPSEEETYWGTDPNLMDTDGDGFSDGQEIANGYSATNAKKIKLRKNDVDQDGLNDAWEKLLGSNPLNPDSDNDGYTDGEEVMTGYSPISSSKDLQKKEINVSIKDQTLRYSFNGIVLDQFLISSAAKGFKTPVGDFAILKKRPTVHYGGPGYDYPNTKWNLLFHQEKYGYYIHGAYWHHNFGKPMSHGCINVSYDNMEDLYNWADSNTIIHIE